MPRKQVYGKKRAPLASFAAYAAVLNSSSPLKPETTNGKPDAELEDVVHDLENLNIQQDGRHIENKEEEEAGRMLKVKDANVRGRRPARRKKDDTSVGSTAVDTDAQEVVGAQRSTNPAGRRTRNAPNAKAKRQPKSTQKSSTEPLQPQDPPDASTELHHPAIETASPPPPSAPVVPPESPQELPCKEHTHLSPLLALSLADADRTEPESFSSWSDQLERHFHVTKIAEASYGEVYRLSLRPSALQQTSLTTADESVLKIIALQLEQAKAFPADTKNAWMSAPAAVAEEVRLLARMTDVPGFTNFRDVRVLRGRPGKAFVQAWKKYNKGLKKEERSIFPDPAKKASYGDDQCWAVVEMQDAGVDVEKGIAAAAAAASTTTTTSTEREGGWNILGTVWGVWDVFWSVALALAKGEEAAEFEHRDLHLGNICVRSTRGDVQGRGVRGAKVRLGQNAREKKLGFTGLETTIIDYTLSRARMTGDGAVTSGREDDVVDDVAFFDLATDPAIFDGDGDVEYQYDMYRSMRAILHTDDPLASTSFSVEVFEKVRQSKATWRDYCPKTNVLWLHFVLFKLMETMEAKDERGLEKVLDQGEKLVEGRKKERVLRAALKKMEKKLRLTALRGENALSSAGALVQFAVEQGWLDEGDVIGSEQSFA